MTVNVQGNLLYQVEGLNKSVRRTNVLLRALNALRLTVRDINNIQEGFSVAKLMWTLIQITRTYNAFKRLYRLTIAEANKGIGITNIFKQIVYVEPGDISVGLDAAIADILQPLNLRIDAYREDMPITLDQISMIDLPEKVLSRMQQVFEDEAQEVVLDAQSILEQRIMNIKRSTGFLESSIGWMPTLSGVRVFAGAPYAWWVEEGQRTFEGHHYMKGALDLSRQRLPEKIRMELNQLILEES